MPSTQPNELTNLASYYLETGPLPTLSSPPASSLPVPIKNLSGPCSSRYTAAGPPPMNETGDIRDLEDALWMEDCLTAEEKAERLQEIRENQEIAKANVGTSADRKKKEFLYEKVKEQAGKNWDVFYRRNGNKFFKDRHYLHVAFPELATSDDNSSKANAETFVLIECGCGVGNSVLPLLEYNPNLVVLGGDFSSVAIDILRKDERYLKASGEDVQVNFGGKNSNEQLKIKGRAFAEVWDITKGPFPGSYVPASPGASPVTFASAPFASGSLLLFCLSALSSIPAMINAVNTIKSHMVDGGVLVFRDYGRYDDGEMKQARGGTAVVDLTRTNASASEEVGDEEEEVEETTTKFGEDNSSTLPVPPPGDDDSASHFYVKQDSTLVYYFSEADLTRIFVEGCGLVIEEGGYITRQYCNRAEGARRRRVWIHGRFRKVPEVKTDKSQSIPEPLKIVEPTVAPVSVPAPSVPDSPEVVESTQVASLVPVVAQAASPEPSPIVELTPIPVSAPSVAESPKAVESSAPAAPSFAELALLESSPIVVEKEAPKVVFDFMTDNEPAAAPISKCPFGFVGENPHLKGGAHPLPQFAEKEAEAEAASSCSLS